MLILVRHGRTEANAQGLLQGRLDLPLDSVGADQAIAVAHRIGRADELISSPLQRARQTADAFDQEYTIDDRWLELAYGEFEGKSYQGIAGVWTQWNKDPHYAPAGGESLATLDARVGEALDELLERAADRVVVVITHVSPIKAAVARVVGGGYDFAVRSHLSHAAICRIELRPMGPVLFSFNETVP